VWHNSCDEKELQQPVPASSLKAVPQRALYLSLLKAFISAHAEISMYLKPANESHESAKLYQTLSPSTNQSQTKAKDFPNKI